MDARELIDALDVALTNAVGKDGFDLDLDEESGAIELATDEWTLVLENWPNGIGFLALDDDSDGGDASELATIIGPALDGLHGVDIEADGAIAAALRRTSDPISNALATLLSTER